MCRVWKSSGNVSSPAGTDAKRNLRLTRRPGRNQNPSRKRPEEYGGGVPGWDVSILNTLISMATTSLNAATLAF
jgi:hypothetical protein